VLPGCDLPRSVHLALWFNYALIGVLPYH